jgi:hypothetical protein
MIVFPEFVFISHTRGMGNEVVFTCVVSEGVVASGAGVLVSQPTMMILARIKEKRSERMVFNCYHECSDPFTETFMFSDLFNLGC